MEKNVKKSYVCLICGNVYATSSARSRHRHTLHEKVTHSCIWCKKRYTRKETLKRHLKLDKTCDQNQMRLQQEIARLIEAIESEMREERQNNNDIPPKNSADIMTMEGNHTNEGS